ncbi:protein LIFEGUARD [Trifolium repens]|nr:protein LIFEGUARD [Trifolium repens]
MSRNVESGESNLNQMKMVHDENPELRWSFIQKVYSIITFQLLLTIPVISVVLFVHPVTNFFNSKQGTVLYIVLIFVPLIGIRVFNNFPLEASSQLFSSPIYQRLFDFTRWINLCLCWWENKSKNCHLDYYDDVYLDSLYILGRKKRSHNLSILRSILYGSLSIFILFSLVQIMFPLGIPLGIPFGIQSGKLLLSRILGCLVSIIFYGYIVYGTESLIKVVTYDQHLTAFVAMYLYLISLFLIPLVFFIGF